MQKPKLFALISFLFPLTLFAAPSDLQPSNLPLNNFTPDQLEQAATAGDPDAQYALGYMYYYGKNGPKDVQAAQNWIKRAAVQGQPQAMNAMRVMGQSVVVAPNPLETVDGQDAASGTAAKKSSTMAKTKPAATLSAPVAGSSAVIATATTTAAPVTPSANPKSIATAHYYTVQLLETASLASVQAYLKKHHLQGKLNYTTSKRNGRNWYSLTYGKYGSLGAAKAGIATLPASVRAQKPKVVGKSEN